jgi:thymidylate kinase
MAIAFHERVYKGYRELILKEPARFAEINADDTEEAIQEAIQHTLAEWLKLPDGPDTEANRNELKHG